MNKESQSEKIEMLLDEIQDLKLDIKHHKKTISELEDKLKIADAKLEDSLGNIEEEKDKIETKYEERLDKIRVVLDNVRETLNRTTRSYIEALCICETIRTKNYSYFSTLEGMRTLQWAQNELSEHVGKVWDKSTQGDDE